MGDGQGQGIRSNQIFNEEDYKIMINTDHGDSNASGNLDHPQSPYSIPKQVRLDNQNVMTPEQMIDSD